MHRLRRSVPGFLAFLWILAPVLAASASSLSAEKAAFPGAEAPVLRDWLRYSVQGSRELLAFPTHPEKTRREISRLEARLRPEVEAARGGADVLDAFRRVLLEEEGFTYDRAPGNPENYLVEGVLARKRGNCLGLSLLFLSLAERFDLPFQGVYVPGHMFVRYEGSDGPVNFEFSEGGAAWPDARYRRTFHLSGNGPYLESLSPGETTAVLLKSLGAAYAKRGRNREALALYAEGARLYPGLPDVSYNAGVSLQRLGRSEDAIEMYRRAIALDPGMALARGNLGILLAMQGEYGEAIAEGRLAVALQPWSAAAHGNLASTYCACGKYEEGILEFRKAMEIDPQNAPVLAGLVRAYYAQGAFREAARACDRAESLGCRFEPAMLEVLNRYRKPIPLSDGAP